MPNTDPPDLDPQPGAALIAKIISAVAAAHPELTVSEHRTRGAALAARGAVGFDGEGEIFIRPRGLESVRAFAPGLLGEPDPAARKPTRLAKAKAAESVLAARAEAARRPRPRLSIAAALAEAVAADRTLQGASSAARIRRAALRDQLITEAAGKAGIDIGAVLRTGVGS